MTGQGACPHCSIAEVPRGLPRSGPHGITEAAMERGVNVMARHDKERTPEQHEQYVRAVVRGIREYLVQRHLYDAVVSELHQARP